MAAGPETGFRFIAQKAKMMASTESVAKPKVRFVQSAASSDRESTLLASEVEWASDANWVVEVTDSPSDCDTFTVKV